MADIRVPEMGESVTEATVGRWLKKVGDSVRQGEVLLELETEKVNLEIAAEDSGQISSIAHAEGDTVTVGDVLAVIDVGAVPDTAPPVGTPMPGPAAAPQDTPAPFAPVAPGPATVPVAPSAARLAAAESIAISDVDGSGRRGGITREDVAGAVARRTSPVAADQAPSANREERVRMSRRRQTIARRLVEAQQTAAMLTTFNEIDMTAVMALRRRLKDSFEKENGVGLGFMSFFTRAVIGGLRAFPNLNAEIDGDEMVLKHYYNIGVAIGAPQGLVVPVLKDADQLGFAAIERRIGELSALARDNKLALDDLTGGSFTITNGGVYGSLMSTPILNTPEVGILGMHKIQERPVAVDGQVVIRPMMYVALSYDHRIVDGREAVQFLVRVKQLVEDPGALLVAN